SAPVDSTNHAVLTFDTRQNPNPEIRNNGIPYNTACGSYHRILWSVEDGCGNWKTCEYLLRLEDCKQPSPVCINGLSTVVMPIGGQVTVWAKDFNASSFDDCASSQDLLYSFSGDAYQPSYTYTCDNVPAFGVELTVQIWVADEGVDHNCDGLIEWSERNKDYCTTTIVITDNNGVCDGTGSVLAGEILTNQSHSVEKVNVNLTSPGHFFPTFITTNDGKYSFNHLDTGLDYNIVPDRDDNPKNGVSTLDLVKIQKHLLGIEIFDSPYQYIAADANNNQQISAIDLVEIRKLILGLYSEFPNNKSWRFVEKGYPMEATHPWPFSEQILIPGLAVDSMMHNDFVAVKIGDVNNSAKANAQQLQPRDGRKLLHVTTPSTQVHEGENFIMSLYIPEAVVGFQWTLETDGLDFVGINSPDIEIGDEHVGVLGRGVVTMSWNGSLKKDHISETGILLQIEWKAKQAGRLQDMIRMTDQMTSSEAYSLQDEVQDVALKFEGSNENGGFALYQNKPNPWNDLTSIGFTLPEEGPALLTIYDLAGKEIFRHEGLYPAGYNTMVIANKQLPAAGVLYYH
ncbi:MAG TPA: hypothetical protein VJ508_02545, partial [Saprospiraceae bacterium]|nr:hypothetical protein [Saprospiraceae bacterium]